MLLKNHFQQHAGAMQGCIARKSITQVIEFRKRWCGSAATVFAEKIQDGLFQHLLDPAALRQRGWRAAADHEMIEQAHVDEFECFAQAQGDRTVGRAGFGDARGMVVREDHCSCVVREATTYDFARMMEGSTEIKCSEFGDNIIEHM